MKTDPKEAPNMKMVGFMKLSDKELVRSWKLYLLFPLSPDDSWEKVLSAHSIWQDFGGEETAEEADPVPATVKRSTSKVIHVAKVKALRAAGWTYEQIGEEFGVTGERIRQILKEKKDV